VARYVCRVPFPYYDRLSKAEKAAYRKSDAKVDVPLSDRAGLRALLPAIEAALTADDRKAVERATQALVRALVSDVGAPPVHVKVLAKRPADGGGELHGLYVSEDGEVPVLRVWMRTHAHKKPVAFRTFVRTVLHEVGHHLDFTILDLEPSFHTEGFFRRESSMARQLLGPGRARAARVAVAAPVDGEEARARQLTLGFE
jgi:hypothetical protein